MVFYTGTFKCHNFYVPSAKNVGSFGEIVLYIVMTSNVNFDADKFYNFL